MEQTATTDLDLKLIPDHTDEGGKTLKEQLGREDMVGAIAKAIMQVEPPFTFGIYGSWGSGKTHFMKSVMKKLEEQEFYGEQNQKPITVMFEAWRHQNDVHPEIAMLACLNEKLDDLDDCNNLDEEAKEKSAARKAALIALIPELEIGADIGIPDIAKMSAKGKLSLRKAIEAYEGSRQAVREMNFKVIDEQIRLKKRFDKLFEKVASEGGSAEAPSRIVFFIDDLDRCLDSTVIKMLEQIKLFLWNKHCVFVLGADSSVIETITTALNHGHEGGKYLEKIVNFPFYLPPLSKTAPHDFFEGKITGTSSTNIINMFTDASIAAKANLRQMIRLANTFKVNSYLTRMAIAAKKNEPNDGSPDYNESITAVFTALQTLHEKIFTKICEMRGQNDREKNLKAVFAEFNFEGGSFEDPLTKVLSAPEDLETISEILDWARTLNIPSDTELSTYVEFLVSQSVAKKPPEDTNRDSSVWYEKDLWVWYKKSDSVVKYIRNDSGYADNEAVAWIQYNAVRGEVRYDSHLITLDGYLWRVINVEKRVDGTPQYALLVSEHIIGTGQMDNEPEDWSTYEYSWSRSALYRELNSTTWLKKHLPTLNASGKIQENHTLETDDDDGSLGKVFLLSTDEANALPQELRAATTPQREADWWWLRSRGVGSPRSAADVGRDGDVDPHGWYSVDNRRGVRPALWLNLES